MTFQFQISSIEHMIVDTFSEVYQITIVLLQFINIKLLKSINRVKMIIKTAKISNVKNLFKYY